MSMSIDILSPQATWDSEQDASQEQEGSHPTSTVCTLGHLRLTA